jgi:plastocyanin
MRSLLTSHKHGLAYLVTILALTLILAAGGSLGASAATNHLGHGPTGSGSGTISTGATPAGTIAVQLFAQVQIDAPSGTFQFDPATLTIQKGTTVTWSNTTVAPHTATSDPGDPASFDSGIINPAGTFRFTFTVTGTYTYHCNIHSFMHGTIVVTS